MPRKKFTPVTYVVMAAAVLAVSIPGGSFLYNAGDGESCTRCHQIREPFEIWQASTHREVACKECHGGTLTLDMNFHASNLRRLVKHVRGEVPPQVVLTRMEDVERVTAKCQQCHRQQYAAWMSGPHSTTYARIFLDETHNSTRALMDDCFRCHGMHFEGGIGDLVTPVSNTGPWKLKRPELADKPAIPCIACHEIHRHGEPLAPFTPGAETSAMDDEVARPSIGLFDRRTRIHLVNDSKPLPRIFEGEREVKMAVDQRQALCYQCHAPRAEMQARSGDDRTCTGVHEGISCLACHDPHTGKAVASCATCHPKMSNCGMAIPRMMELMMSPASPFDIHTVTCQNCHPKGVPERRAAQAAPARSPGAGS